MRSSVPEYMFGYKKDITLLAIYSFLFLFFASQMSPLYPINDWSDINIYYNIGKGIVEGKTLYIDLFDHKGPLIYFIYAVGYLLHNPFYIGMFIIELAGWIIMLISSYLISRQFLTRGYAILICLLIPFILLPYMGKGGSAEEFILYLEFISLYYFVTYFKEKGYNPHRPQTMLIHGIIVSCVFFIKLNFILFFTLPIAALFISIFLSRHYKNLLQNFLFFILGILIVSLPIILYLYLNNALNEAYNTYILLNGSYANLPPLNEMIVTLANRFIKLLRTDTLFFIIQWIGIIVFPIKYINNKLGGAAFLITGFVLLLSINWGLTYHYYYPVPLCIFTFLGLIAVALYIQRFISITTSKTLFTCLTIAALCLLFSKISLYGFGIDVLTRKTNAGRIENQFGKIILKEANPTLLNLGAGEGVVIFTECRIVPSIKYFFTPNIPYEIFPAIRDEQTKYIEKGEIQFIVLSRFAPNFDYFYNLDSLHQKYRLVDTCELNAGGYTARAHTYYLYKRIE